MKFLKKILTPPVFDDEVKSQRANLLHVIVWTLICVPIPFVIYSFFQTPGQITRTFIQAGFGETVNIILLVMLRRGYVRAASIIQVSAFWLFFTVTAMTGSGVRGEAYLLGYGLVIAIAGILLGGRGALTFSFLSLAMGAFMVFQESRGIFVPVLEASSLTTWVVSLVLFPVSAVLQYLATRTIRHALARARASEERYRLISQVSSDYTFSTVLDDDGNMFLSWVAGAFTEITGYTYEEYVASGGWLAHLHPDDIEKDAGDMETVRQNKKVVTEIRTFNKNQELRWVRVYGHPVWDNEKNQLKGIVGAVQDITDRKQVEAEREALILELEVRNRELEAINAELERFTYTVSHDLKSPLVTITGFLGFLEKDAANGNAQRVKSNIDRINGAAQKMQALLNDLLELSRIGRLMNPPEDVLFEEIVHEAVDRVRGRLDEVGAIIEIQKDLPVVHGDRIRLVEVVQNLIDNAAKYSNPAIRTRIEIGISGISEKGCPVFFVRDNGIGIEPQYHERIFGLFNKLDAQSEGTGIGLSLVKRIIEVHNGRIWVESEKGKGATFHFSLPPQPQKE